MTRLLATLSILATSHAFAWTPPPDADPQAILREALDDRVAGRYEDSLAKHEWFHREALKRSPSLYAVRTSFALAWWADLAQLYAPAMASLRKVRDESGEAVRQGRDAERAFADFAAINRELDDPLATVAVFLDVEKRDPALARKLFHAAEDPLLDARYFEVAGRYAQPAQELESATGVYRNMSRRAAPSKEVDFAALNERYFGTAAGRLVALLVLVDRKPEAEKLAKQALEVSSSETVKGLVEAGLQGRMPQPFISREERTKAKAAP